MTATLPPLPDLVVALRYPHTSRAAMLYTDSQMEVYSLAAIAAQAQPAPIVVQPDFYVRSVDTVWINKPNFNSVNAMLWSKPAAGRVPCYLATPPVVLVVQPTPLTKAQLWKILESVDTTTARLPLGFELFARAIELAHGISAPVVPTLSPGDEK